MEKRRLPRIKIEGTWFIADVDKECLIQKQFRWNRIRFSDMKFNGDHYFFSYDPNYRNIHFAMDNPQKVKMVCVPQMKVLDPIGMSMRFNIPVEEVKHLSDKQMKAGLRYRDICGQPLPPKPRWGRKKGSRNKLKFV